MSDERLLVTGAAQSGRLHRKPLLSIFGDSSKLTHKSPLSEIYRKAVLLEIDFAENKTVRRLEVNADEMDYRIKAYATNFGVPCRIDNRLLAPSHAEILEIDIDTFQVLSKKSHRLLNDTHHVLVKDGKMYVASTGIDRVLVLDGDDCEAFPTIPNAKPLKPNVDYRLVNMKPDKSHPNFVTFVDDELWVTRAKQHDWAPLFDFSRAIPLAEVIVHDGYPFQGFYFFTAVNGQIIVVDPQKKEVAQRLDLTKNIERGLTGWCRGLLVTEKYYYVGFSIIRMTRYVENLQWLKAKLLKKDPPLPTRIEKVERSTGEVVGEFTFEPNEMTAIFWIGLV